MTVIYDTILQKDVPHTKLSIVKNLVSKYIDYFSICHLNTKHFVEAQKIVD